VLLSLCRPTSARKLIGHRHAVRLCCYISAIDAAVLILLLEQLLSSSLLCAQANSASCPQLECTTKCEGPVRLTHMLHRRCMSVSVQWMSRIMYHKVIAISYHFSDCKALLSKFPEPRPLPGHVVFASVDIGCFVCHPTFTDETNFRQRNYVQHSTLSGCHLETIIKNGLMCIADFAVMQHGVNCVTVMFQQSSSTRT